MTQNKSMRSLALAAVLAVATGATALAQNTTQGAIAGTVFDPSGAVVPNATIVIHNDGTNAETRLTAGGSGEFKAPQLQPGTYTVTISAPGFQEQRTTALVVQVQQVTELNPHLTTGSESSTVSVTADIPAINFESPDFGGHLSNREIENIPINNRRWSTLALTTPGVTIDTSGFGLLQFRAIAPTLNNVQIDGADDNQAFFSEERGRTRAGYSTSQAMVREFQVNTGVYSAEFGRAVGGVVNSVTKTGTNQFHGELYFYNRNDELSAFNAYTTIAQANAAGGVTSVPFKPKDKRNQYGFNLGGPLKKDRVFFEYAFDVFDRQFPGVARANNPAQFFDTPDAALPNGSVCNTATGAITGVALPSGTGINSQGVTTTFQSSRDTEACLLAARLNQRSAGNTYASAAAAYSQQLSLLAGDLGLVPRYGHQNINTPKINWQITPKHNLSVLYHRLRWDSPGGVQTAASVTNATDYFGTDFVKLDYGLAKLNSLVTDHIANELRYQYGRELNDEGQQPYSSYTNNFLRQSNGNVPQIALYTTLGFNLGSPYYSYRVAYPDERKWQVGDTLSLTFGKHNIRLGEDIVHNYDLQNAPNQINGAYSYTSNVGSFIADKLQPAGTCGANAAGTGQLPCYNTYLQSFGPYTFDFATMDYGFFVQDDWKVAPRLTLNLGARYDYESIPQPFAALANPAVPQTTGHPDDKNNISPRVGFAWDPYGQGKTVLRGGYGFYYGRIANSVLLSALTQTGSTAGAYNISYTNQSANRPTFGQQVNPALASSSGGGNVVYLDNHFQNPVTYQADLTVQQDLGRNNVFSLAYLGSWGRELPNFINVNQNPNSFYTETYTVQPATAGGVCNLVACGTQLQTRVYAGRQYAATGNTPALNSIAQNTAYGAVTQLTSNVNSSYHGLSADITNRSFHWVTFDANYTWAHALDFSQSSYTGTSVNSWLDPFGNQRANYGTSTYDIRQRVVGWAILNIPGIENNKSALSYLTNGWSIKPLIQAQSGLPYSATVTGSTPNFCTDNTQFNKSGTQFCRGTLAPTAATNSGLLGTSVTYIPQIGRNTFRFPRVVNVDARVQKDFPLRAGANLQLMIEAFNLANHQNVTGVNTSAFAIASPAASTAAAPNQGTANGFANLTTNTTFGSVTNSNSNYAYAPRQFQIAARITF